MTTLIAVYDSDGCRGRCDERCYGAQHPDCHCICGGKNHGAGLAAAQANTQTMAQGWIDEYAAQHSDIADKLIYEVPAAQLSLL